MSRDPAWMLAAFLTAGKRQCVFGRLTVAGKSGGAPPVDHDGDPSVLIRLEAQPIRRPAPLAQPHRHVGGIGGFGHGEAGADAPLRGIDEHSATTMPHSVHQGCEWSRQEARRQPATRTVGFNGNRRRASPRDVSYAGEAN
jgi:hypothetical protein